MQTICPHEAKADFDPLERLPMILKNGFASTSIIPPSAWKERFKGGKMAAIKLICQNAQRPTPNAQPPTGNQDHIFLLFLSY